MFKRCQGTMELQGRKRQGNSERKKKKKTPQYIQLEPHKKDNKVDTA